MNLETKWLEDFSTLATTRSFSQAAEKRFVTQPAFSRRIRALEESVGLTLVDRSHTPVSLTEAGQLFLVTARSVECPTMAATLSVAGCWRRASR